MEQPAMLQEPDSDSHERDRPWSNDSLHRHLQNKSTSPLGAGDPTETVDTTCNDRASSQVGSSENHESESTEKARVIRDRAVLVCLNCRKRRRKCDRQYPVCGRCSKDKQEHLCVWDCRRDTTTTARKYQRRSAHSKQLKRAQATISRTAAVFCNRTYFDIIISCSTRIHELLLTPGMDLCTLSNHYDYWRSMMLGDKETIESLTCSALHTSGSKLGKVDVFCLLSSFAHSCTYLNCKSASQLALLVSEAALEAAVDLSENVAEGTLELTPRILGSCLTFFRQVELHNEQEDKKAFQVIFRAVYASFTKDPRTRMLPDYYTAMCGCIFYGRVGDPLEMLNDLVMERLHVAIHDATLVEDIYRLRSSAVCSVFILELIVAVIVGMSPNHNSAFLFIDRGTLSHLLPMAQLVGAIGAEVKIVRQALTRWCEKMTDCRWLQFLEMNSRCSSVLCSWLTGDVDNTVISAAVQCLRYFISDYTNNDHPLNTTTHQLFTIAIRVVASYEYETFCIMMTESGVITTAAAIFDTYLSKRGLIIFIYIKFILQEGSAPKTDTSWVELGARALEAADKLWLQ